MDDLSVKLYLVGDDRHDAVENGYIFHLRHDAETHIKVYGGKLYETVAWIESTRMHELPLKRK